MLQAPNQSCLQQTDMLLHLSLQEQLLAGLQTHLATYIQG